MMRLRTSPGMFGCLFVGQSLQMVRVSDKYYHAFQLAVGGKLFERITQHGHFSERSASVR